MALFDIKVDATGFDRVLRQYQAATQKDMAYVVNRAMNNWSIQSAKFVKEAMESKIRSLRNLPWWPKLIASIMVRRAAFRASKALAKTGGKVTAGRHAVTRFFRGRGFYTRDQARRRSERILSKRVQARRFLRAFFIRWSAAIREKVPGVTGRFQGGWGRFSRFIHAEYKPATPKNLKAEIRVWYDYKKRSGKGIELVHAMFERAKTAGLARTIADMQKYMREIAQKRARQSLGKYAA